MRTVPDSSPIWAAWNSGGYLVDDVNNRPHTRVTVEPGFQLNLQASAGNLAPYLLPVRWWQNAANSQAEVEIPNIRQVQANYDLTTDADTCDITIENQQMAASYQSQSATELGFPGSLAPDYGASGNRWGYTPNQWSQVLTINALIRVYHGYGGHQLGAGIQGIRAAQASGNLILSGVWMVDTVEITTKGVITLHCRSMAKLLVDQQVYVPLVPPPIYPISWSRFFYVPVFNPIIPYGPNNAPQSFDALGRVKNVVAILPTADRNGYLLIGSDGGVFAYGDAVFRGSLGSPGIGVITPGATIVGASMTPDGGGYWLVDNFGNIYTFGDAQYSGGTGTQTLQAPVVGVSNAPGTSNNGYYVFAADGGVFTFGGAQFYGSHPTLPAGDQIVGGTVTPNGGGYWLVDSKGNVFSYGNAQYYGGTGGVTLNAPVTGIAASPTGNGYYLTAADGGVFTFGDAQFQGSVPGTTRPSNFGDASTTQGSTTVTSTAPDFTSGMVGYPITGTNIPAGATVTGYTSPTQITISAGATATGVGTVTTNSVQSLNAPVTGIAVGANGGYWLTSQDGGVFTFGEPFYGSMPGQSFSQFPINGNYLDYVDIIKYFALWSGFCFYTGSSANVYGNIETTGIYSPNIIDATVFDKRPVIDGMKKIRDVVGYILHVDDTGGLCFYEPNYWGGPSNRLPSGAMTSACPVIDEKIQLTDFDLNLPDQDLRSVITISSNDPLPDTGGGPPPGTVTASYVPAFAYKLRGMIKPAVWVNEVFTDITESQIMAQLVALHIQFRSRLGRVTCLANPMIQVDDQVQIVERQSGEMNVHYVSAIRRTHDLKTGVFTDELTTNFLSPPGSWQVQKPAGTPGTGTITSNRF